MVDPALYKRHANLLDRTASRLGLDLEEEAISGRLDFDEISGAVIRCTQCADPEACERWLASPETGEEKPPAYCANGALLERLKGQGQ